MSSVTDAINSAATNTAIHEAETDTVKGAASENLSQSDFLKLLTEQLQYQDPMEPQDNSQFVSQINQFAQLNSLNTLNTNVSTNNNTMQTLALVGKTVNLVDPDDAKKTITGEVTDATFSSSGSSITVNGKSYPISLVKGITTKTATTGGTTTGGTTTGGTTTGGTTTGGTTTGGTTASGSSTSSDTTKKSSTT